MAIDERRIRPNCIEIVIVDGRRQWICTWLERLLAFCETFARLLWELKLSYDLGTVGHIGLGLPGGLTLRVAFPFHQVLLHIAFHPFIENLLHLVYLLRLLRRRLVDLLGYLSLRHTVSLCFHWNLVFYVGHGYRSKCVWHLKINYNWQFYEKQQLHR